MATDEPPDGDSETDDELDEGVASALGEDEEDEDDAILDVDLEVVEIEPVPLSDELEAQLEAFILIDAWELSVSRAETTDFLVDTLAEQLDDDNLEEWVDSYGERDFHLYQERDGRLVFSDVFPLQGVVGFVPKILVSAITAELMEQDEDEQEGWIESLSDFIAESLSLLGDEEKMVGHLIRGHELGIEETEGEHGELVARHAGLHAEGAAASDDDEDDGEED